uniref:Uncharacterized protein n=1 Tax=Leersia perrieri TaxID=77586 RepID=A0A0D9W610_9ORYZ
MQSSRRILLRLRAPTETLLSRMLSSSPSYGGGGGGVAVKQVTRGNLADALEELRARVRDAAFVGIDLEMSGVTSAPWRDTFEFDRADVRYLKLRDSAERFAALQLGVCPFRWDPAKSSFVAHPHNFFIFPHNELLNDCSSHEFLCQTTSIDFLANYQFDFNTCFREGIYYLSRTQEEEALQKLYKLHHNDISAYPNTCEEEEDTPLKSAADILFTERMKIKFNEWRNSIVGNQRVDGHGSENIKFADQFQTVFFKMRPAVMLDGFTSHQLNLIRQVLRKRFRDLVYVCTFCEDGLSEKRVVYTDTNDDKILLSCFTSGAKHEAGYDAFMTGCVFVQLCDYLGIKFEHLSPLENLATNINLKKHINLLAPCWNSGTVVDLSTGTERPHPGYKRRYPVTVYDNVVLIWGFQSKVRPKDIKDCICKVFGPASLTSVFPIDSTSVLVQFSKRESVDDFMDLKATLDCTDSAISALHPLSTILEGGQTRAAKYDTYRDICGSSVSKFSFADQAEAVCSTSNAEFKSKESNAADGYGAYESALDGTVPSTVEQAEGTKSGSKNQGENDFSLQDILDALQDGKELSGKRMRNA